jgi:hypothetical protein
VDNVVENNGLYTLGVCAGSGATITVTGDCSTFCCSTIFTSSYFGSKPVGYNTFLGYGGYYVSVSGNGISQAIVLSTCNPCPTPTTAIIQISGVENSGDIRVRAEVISGTTADLLDFDVELYKYSDTGCVTNIGTCTHSGSLIIPSGVTTGFGWETVTNCTTVGVQSVKAFSIAVNGTTFIATNPQTIIVGGNYYQIFGFDDCTLL